MQLPKVLTTCALVFAACTEGLPEGKDCTLNVLKLSAVQLYSVVFCALLVCLKMNVTIILHTTCVRFFKFHILDVLDY